MKKTLLTCSVFIFCFHAHSQNWSVINSVERFNYRLDSDNIITSTILVDSFQLSGSDSIFFLNRIVCDTCATIPGGPNACDTCYGVKNRPQFLQRECRFYPSGIVNFTDTGNLVINTLASLNDTWLFDSVQNISATIVALEIDSVFGNTDSVKTILLTSGDTLKLSKDFGLIQYPNHYGQNSYFRLVGIEGRNLGEHVPNFFDFFNFDVGDMFEYHLTGGSSDCNIDERRKYEIISKQIYPDSVLYSVQGIYAHYEWPIWWWASCWTNYDVYNYGTTMNYYDSSTQFSNFYNLEGFNLAHHIYEVFIYPHYNVWGGLLNDSIYDHVRMYADSNQILTKSFGIIYNRPWFGENDCRYYYLPYNNSDTLHISNVGGIDGCQYTATYKVGLGLTDYEYGPCFEGVMRWHLEAFRKGNDTTGVFTPDSVLLLGTKDEIYQNTIKISPNPTNGKLKIETREPIEQIELFNLLGEKVPAAVDYSLMTVDCQLLPPGIYILQASGEGKVWRRKVIKE